MQETEAQRSLIDHIERAHLRLNPPATPLRLDDDRLLECRHPTEKAKLMILQSTTPPLIYRLKAMVEWAVLPLNQENRASSSDEEMKQK